MWCDNQFWWPITLHVLYIVHIRVKEGAPHSPNSPTFGIRRRFPHLRDPAIAKVTGGEGFPCITQCIACFVLTPSVCLDVV